MKSDPTSQSSGILPSFSAIIDAIAQVSKHVTAMVARLPRLCVFRRTCSLFGL